MTFPLPSPISQHDRINVLDFLRGIAVCGILLMNIPGFAFPSAASFDPTIYNEAGTINYKVHIFIDWLPEGTQRALFSMLFGAGMLIFLERLESRTRGTIAAEIFMRRQLWLLLFGLTNAFIFLWHWDVLYAYALCGILVMPFRRLSPGKLFAAAGVALLIISAREVKHLYEQKAIISKGEAVALMDTTTVKWTKAQEQAWNRMNDFKKESELSFKQNKAKEEVEKVLGSYKTMYELRSDMSVNAETRFLYYYAVWDIILCMLLGMAFFKLGIMQGTAPFKWYIWMAVIGWSTGLLLSWLRMESFINTGFNDFERTRLIKWDGYELSRMFRSIGMLGTLFILYRLAFFARFFQLFQPVGQMAFTNYLMQSVICGLFFYGVGFGNFGKLQRYEIYFVVLVVWVIQIIYSHIWMRYYLFGPFEWLWRTLTYWKKQPMRRTL